MSEDRHSRLVSANLGLFLSIYLFYLSYLSLPPALAVWSWFYDIPLLGTVGLGVFLGIRRYLARRNAWRTPPLMEPKPMVVGAGALVGGVISLAVVALMLVIGSVVVGSLSNSVPSNGLTAAQSTELNDLVNSAANAFGLAAILPVILIMALLLLGMFLFIGSAHEYVG